MRQPETSVLRAIGGAFPRSAHVSGRAADSLRCGNRFHRWRIDGPLAPLSAAWEEMGSAGEE